MRGVERGDADGVVVIYLDFFDADFHISADHSLFLALSIE
jgi:hypothetical protein